VRIRLPQLKLRGYLAITAVAIALTVSQAAPVHASTLPTVWILADGFEANPASTWTFSGSPACGICGYFATDAPQAHTGNRWASVQAMASNSFFSVGRTVTLTPAATHAASCVAHIYVKLPAGQLNFEVINPATWTYIALTTINTTSDTGYRNVSAGPWTTGPVNVVIRVSVLRNGNPPTTAFANVDDLLVQCI
jgi:hypothetical protein